VARHITIYGRTSSDEKEIMIRFSPTSWYKLHRVGESFKERDLYTQSRFHDTLNQKYPSVRAYIKALEKILIGDIKPKMKMRAFKFDEVSPKLVASDFKHIMTGIKRKLTRRAAGMAEFCETNLRGVRYA